MRADFDLAALHAALDDKRRASGLTWAAVAREVNRFATTAQAVAASTISGVATKAVAEGDGVLQMLIWLERTPESFVPGFPDSSADRYRLPAGEKNSILRWDTEALYAALDAKRRLSEMTWADVAREIGGMNAAMLSGLATRSRVGFPGVMRVVGWLGEPAASFTRSVQSRSDQ
jgi:hypothetical protein